jgi:hypothetical protein
MGTDSTAPATHTPADAPADDVRMVLLDARPALGSVLDGAWWPRSHDLTGELPGLVAELHRRGIRVTRAAYSPGTWDPAPRRVDADGRVVKLGWYNGLDPHLLALTGDLDRVRLDLLVVPPEDSSRQAEEAFAAAAGPGNDRTPSGVLAGLG